MQDALDHPWFVGDNKAISKMRKEAINEDNEMLKFISYSNVDPVVTQNVTRLSQGSESSSKPNCYDPPSLKEAIKPNEKD